MRRRAGAIKKNQSVRRAKKWVLALVAVLIVVGGYWAWFGQKTESEYARYLPDTTVATVNVLHLSQMSAAFPETVLGQIFAQDNMHALIKDLGGTREDQQEYDRMAETATAVFTNPSFKAIFGHDLTLAVLPVFQEEQSATIISKARQSLVLLARTSVAGALDLLSRLVRPDGVSREVVDGLELVRVELEPGQVFYGYTEGKMLFLAYSPAAIKACLLAADKEGHPLAEKTPFIQALENWQQITREQSFLRVFFQPEYLAPLFTGIPAVSDVPTLLQGVDVFSLVAYQNKKSYETRAQATYTYQALHPLLRSAVDSASHPNNSLRLLEGGSLAYGWSSSLRPEMVAHFLASHNLDPREVDAAVSKQLGFGLSALPQALGPQVGFVLDDMVRAALFPAPKMSFFAGLRDRPQAVTLLQGLRQAMEKNDLIHEEQEQINGVDVYSWPLLADKDAHPALALTDSMLMLATSKAGITTRLQALQKPVGLQPAVATQLGESLSARLSNANSGVLLLYPQRMAPKIRQTLYWLGGIVASTRNISLTRVNQSVLKLMESAEVVLLTANLEHAHAKWTLSLEKSPQTVAPKP